MREVISVIVHVLSISVNPDMHTQRWIRGLYSRSKSYDTLSVGKPLRYTPKTPGGSWVDTVLIGHRVYSSQLPSYHNAWRRVLTSRRTMSTGGGAWRLFEGSSHAEAYGKFRPTYPASVIEAILSYCDAGGCGRGLAVDVACGGGQSTWSLVGHFKRVIGSDISEAQIREAAKLAGQRRETSAVEFFVNKAEDMAFLPDQSVDLITCAQGYHWLDHQAFCVEAQRVLKPEGVLVAYGYGNPTLDLAKGQELVDGFYDGTLHGYWSPQRRHVESHYCDFDLAPFADFTRLGDLAIDLTMPLSALMGYLSSWSAYRSFLVDHPQSSALADLHESLLKTYRGCVDSSDPDIHIQWAVFLLLARNT